ncbi:MAG TPA: cell division protein FtsQ/DivIB [Solirubrobacteraceae bacterium]|nr:cell division protein FtsQ/DivIB [Solirubrobacteraceae bacterium]
MSRSLAAAPTRHGRGAPVSRRAGRRPPAPAMGVPRPLAAAASLLPTAAAWLARHRRLRMALLTLTLVLALLAGGWLWFRQSSFVAIQRVRISGVHGQDAAAVEAALTQAARGMSTLDVSDGTLRAAVAPLRVVREVRAIPSFPHALRIEVLEQLPVASLSVGGVRTAVAADGDVLGPALLSSSLPSISGSPSGAAAATGKHAADSFGEDAADDAAAPAAGQRVGGATLLAELTVLGAAPALLARHVERVFTGAEGLTVAMRNGLLVYFGDDVRPHAKWLSLARVLADQSSAGASYIDVRVPSHPAAGFPAGVSPPDASTSAGAGSAGEQPGGTESTVAALAADLASSGEVSSPASASEPSAASPPAAETTAASPSEAASSSQAPPPAGAETSPAPPAEGTASAGTSAGG